MGTAGCLYLLKNKKITDPIIIINGDVLTDMDYRQLIDYHNKSNKLITVCAAIYDIQIPFGTIELDEDKLSNIVENVLVFKNGKEAYDSLKQMLSKSENLPEIIFLDLKL